MHFVDLETDVDDEALRCGVTGRLFYPDRTQLRGIIVYHPGTSTHPPHSATEGKFDFLAEALLPTGYAILVPDYVGYGINAHQTRSRYLYRPHAGLESFQLLWRTISDLTADGLLEDQPDVRLCGYSMGAYHALGLLHRLEAMPELCRPTLFAGGGIFDLEVQFNHMLQHGRYDAPAYIAYLLGSLLGTQDSIACFSPNCREAVTQFYRDNSRDLAALNERLPRELASLFNMDNLPQFLPQIETALQANSMKLPQDTVTKITLYHARHDELCYLENLEAFLKESGVSVNLLLGDAPSHGEGSKEYFGLLLKTLGLEGC